MEHYDILRSLYTSGLVKAPQLLLLAIYDKTGEGATSGTLLARTGIAWSHISTSLTNMERSGMVERRFPLRDLRSVTVYLTPEGKKNAKRMLKALGEARQKVD